VPKWVAESKSEIKLNRTFERAAQDPDADNFGEKKMITIIPIDQVLFQAIDMCQVYEVKDRPKAGEVLQYLKGEAKRLGIEWDKKFGE